MRKLAAASLVLFFALTACAGAQEAKEQKQATDKQMTEKKAAEEVKQPLHQYVGVSKCAMCHRSKARGDQYDQWKSTAHASAYVNLAGDAAKKAGKEKGVDDPQKSPKCLKCHVAGYGAPKEQLADSYSMEDGVSCEACHGPGSDYMKLSIMKDKEKAIAAGLIMPTKEVCVTCHNEESPTFVSFDFDKMFPKIAHPIPKAEEGGSEN
jgi:hypothetical protein